MTNLETMTLLYLHTTPGIVTAVRGDALIPEVGEPGTVAFVRTDGAWLNREDAAKLGRFLLDAAGKVSP